MSHNKSLLFGHYIVFFHTPYPPQTHLDGLLLVFGEPRPGAGGVVIRLVVDDFGSFRVSFVEFQQSVLVRLRLSQPLGQLGFFARQFRLLLLLLLLL